MVLVAVVCAIATLAALGRVDATRVIDVAAVIVAWLSKSPVNDRQELPQ